MRPHLRTRRGSLLAGLGLLASLTVGCAEEEPEPLERPPAEPIPRSPVAAPRAIASPAAFDLVPTAEGALLLWGSASARGGAVQLLALDRQGAARGPERRVFLPALPTEGDALTRLAPEAVELAAAAGGGRLGVAWISRFSAEYSVLAVHGDVEGAGFSPPRTLARLTAVEHTRGHLAVAASGTGELRVIFETGRGRCPEGSGRCARFAIRGIGATAGREGVPLGVPEPCRMAITGFVSAGGSWYYGVCAQREGAPTTTVFAIQYEPEYAHSTEVLAGCAPLGMTGLADGVALVGACEGGPEAVRLRDAGREVVDVGAVDGRIKCDGGRPVLSTGIGRGLILALDAPAGRLEALMPPSHAPAGSRAVWTGEALLVAVPLGPEVSLARYACEDGELLRTNLP